MNSLFIKPSLITQAERTLTEIALLRDQCEGELLEHMERAWQEVNQIRQSLIDSLTPQQELALVKQQQQMHQLKRPEQIIIKMLEDIPPIPDHLLN